MGSAAAIWGVNNAICYINGHPKWELVPLGRHHQAASVVWNDDGSLTPRGFPIGGPSLEVI